MITKALWVRLEAADGRADDVASFLEQGQALVEQEPGTSAWFAVRLGPSTFGIFDVFEDDEGRDAHLNGEVAKALGTNADMFAQPPEINKLEVLGAKL